MKMIDMMKKLEGFTDCDCDVRDVCVTEKDVLVTFALTKDDKPARKPRMAKAKKDEK